MSYDLLLESPSRVNDELFELVFSRAAALPSLGQCECRRGALPDPRELDDLVEDEEVSRDVYSAYCQACGLDPDLDCSAQDFLIQLYGVTVLSVHLPKDNQLVARALRECLDLAEQFGLTLHDPQAGETLSLDYTGDYPPLY